MAQDDFGARSGLHAQKLRADGNAAVRANFDLSAETPDQGPPRAVGFGAQHGALFLERKVPSFLGSHFEFAVDFVLIAVETQGVDMRVGLVEIDKVLAGEVGGQALLPEEMSAFDFAFGLGRGGVAERDAVEVQGLTQLRESLGIMGEEEAVVIDVDFQGQAVLAEGGWQEIEVGQQGFALIDLGAGKDAAAIVEHVEHGKGLWTAGEPAVGRGVQLPEFTDLAALPASDGSERAGTEFGLGQVVLDGPATDLSPVDFEVTFAEHFAGGKAVGSWGFAVEPLVQQRMHFGWPVAGMIASGKSGRPKGLLLMGAGFEVIGVKFVEATAGEPELFGGGFDFEVAGAKASQHVTDQGSGTAMCQL